MKKSGFRDGKHFMVSERAIEQLLHCVALLADIKPSIAKDLHRLIEYVKNCPNISYAGFSDIKKEKQEKTFTLEEILKQAGITYPDQN